MRPNVPVPSDAPGFPNCGVVKAVNHSVRNRSWLPSRYGMRIALDTDRSNVCKPGPTMGFRGDVPYVVLRENASVLNQRVGTRSSSVGFWPAIRFGRGQSASAFQVSPL